MPKQLEVQVAPEDLELLKANKDLLCFAWGANDSPTVVWQCFDDYLQNNPFSWVDQYQAFGSQPTNPGGVVTIDSGPMPIELFQKTVLNAEGVFQPPVQFGMPDTLTIEDNYTKEILLGYCIASIGPDGVQRSTPAFAIIVPPKTEITITPKDIVRVWFQQNVVTGTVVSNISNFIEVDFQTRDFAKLRFQNGKWSEQPGG